MLEPNDCHYKKKPGTLKGGGGGERGSREKKEKGGQIHKIKLLRVIEPFCNLCMEFNI